MQSQNARKIKNSIQIPNPNRKGIRRRLKLSEFNLQRITSTGVIFNEVLSDVVTSENGSIGFIIPFNTKLTEWEIEYIQDCWVQFVTQDLGYTPNVLPMVCFQIEAALKESARLRVALYSALFLRYTGISRILF